MEARVPVADFDAGALALVRILVPERDARLLVGFGFGFEFD